MSYEIVVHKSDTCPWCRKYRGTLSHPAVREVLGGVPITLRDAGPGIDGVPKTELKSGKDIVAERFGYMDVPDFLNWSTQSIENHRAARRAARKRMREGPRDPFVPRRRQSSL